MTFNKFSECFSYIEVRNHELIEKYGFNKFEFDPEFIYESTDLKWFVDNLSSNLFPEDKYEFTKDFISKDGNHFIVKFRFCDEEFKIYTRSDDDFIGGNYFDILLKMNQISSSKTHFTTLLPSGLPISGKKEELEKARAEGLGVSVNNELQFWHVNSRGERMKPNEEFYIHVKLLNKGLEIIEIPDCMLKGIANLTTRKSRLTSYTENQINFIKSNGNYQIYIDGIRVSSENSELTDNQFKFDYKPAGKILAYGFLLSLDDDSVKIELKYSVNNEKNRNIERAELLNLIEEYVK